MSAIQTKNLGFILRMLGREAGPASFLREITQNSLEAIIRAGVPGSVKWDLYCPDPQQNPPVYKLACVDTGTGMTGEQLVERIGQVSSSGQEQTAEGNFGVGAKISAFCRNEYGLTYMSWTSGNEVGSGMTIWWDSEDNNYAIKPVYSQEWWTISTERSAELKAMYGIGDHGTIVVFGGNEADEDTTVAPIGFEYQTQWIVQYLGSRYYEFPATVDAIRDVVPSVLVRAFPSDRKFKSIKNRDEIPLVTVECKKSILDSQSDGSGSVDLSDATVYYWIIKENTLKGQLGLLYQGEIYQLFTGSEAYGLFQKAGIVFGGQRIALMVCPTSGIFANLTRQSLTDADGEEVPWGRWMSELKAKLPDAIKEFMRQFIPIGPSNYRQAYQSRLEELLNFFARGKEGSGRRRRRHGHSSIEPLTRPPLTYPKEIRWVTTADGSRAEGDMENLAAKYVLEGDLLLINKDFSIHQNILSDLRTLFPAYAEEGELLLREWQEQQYVEAILSAKKLQNRRLWSQESLTAVGGVIWNVWQQVKRELEILSGD